MNCLRNRSPEAVASKFLAVLSKAMDSQVSRTDLTNDQFLPQSSQRPTDLVLRTRCQAALTALGQKALSGSDLAELFNAATELIMQTLPVTYSQIWQILSDGVTCQPVSSAGEANSVEQSLDPKPQFLLEDTDRATEIPEQASSIPPGHSLKIPEDASSIRVLIPGQTKPLGLISVRSIDSYQFTTEDIHFLQAITHVLATAIERKRSETLLQTQTRVLESIAAGINLQQVFDSLCLLLEQQSPGVLCSILLFDRITGKLQAGAAPSLAPEIAAALDGLVIGEGRGSCATAAYRGEAVFVTNVATDPVWQSCRNFALSHNIQACWSTPFFSQTGELLGTFALSHCVPCEPTAYHLEMMKTAAHLASIAIEGRRAADQLKQQALHDSLTGLPNRLLFMEQLQQRLQQHQQNRHNHFAVLFLDVDQFKLINDSLGHNVGDQMLVEIAHRLQQCLGNQEIFARLGGDEFAILLQSSESIAQAQQLAHQMQSALSTPLKLKEHEIFASISIGIAHSSNHYDYAEELLRDADTAMYRAKSLGRERYVIFDQTMHIQTVTRLQFEIDLRRAVEELTTQGNSQFQLYYQPIVSLTTHEIIGFEALIRWFHPERGLISPLDFIPIAEETGLIVPIGHWVLHQACQQLRQWQDQFQRSTPLMMSVNVSSCQFLQPNFVSQVEAVLQSTQLSASSLKLEITESVLLEAATAVMAQLEQLQTLNIRLSLDDFGTGYSSLSYLYHLPVHTLKIDRSFVQKLDQGQAKIVQTIITLTQSLEMNAIAEGIETAEQLTQLQEFGCEYGQGYFFSPPVPHNAAEAMLSEQTFSPQSYSLQNNHSGLHTIVPA